MYQSIDWPEGGVWVDLGGGTGANLEYVADEVPRLKHVYVVDLADSLLQVCEQRVAQREWSNVTAVAADATTFTPAEGAADVVTFSYSLTMIPDWFAAIDNALRLLKPGGLIGVVDFYVSRKHAEQERKRHSFATRHFWRTWFDGDSVYPSPDHLPYLARRFETVRLEEQRAKIPYLPFVRAPYYQFVGRKPAE
jgi:S-adenosylmethionine-diacylgycerolhomoserine-N-methlytransferase